jgi:hypothetical protein
MFIECYRQDDLIGFSFSEMNASYVYWDWKNNGGKTVFIDGGVIVKPKHLLVLLHKQ